MSQTRVSSLIVPMQGMGLLVPSALVAEVIPFAGMEAKTKGPDWLLGEVVWRGQKLPVLSFECANGEGTVLPRPGSRFAVMQTLNEGTAKEFYALLVHGQPSPAEIDPGDLEAVEGPEAHAVKTYVRYQGQVLRVPDPDALEPLLGQLA
ncbi:MAG: chemotaxis protein CheW [Gammaproteobacteria bacterium]|nr:chemotaxis protein CheW [Gammaproteobacteria bacterium]